eukprot:7322891-Prymnesium_polylepis.1
MVALQHTFVSYEGHRPAHCSWLPQGTPARRAADSVAVYARGRLRRAYRLTLTTPPLRSQNAPTLRHPCSLSLHDTNNRLPLLVCAPHHASALDKIPQSLQSHRFTRTHHVGAASHLDGAQHAKLPWRRPKVGLRPKICADQQVAQFDSRAARIANLEYTHAAPQPPEDRGHIANLLAFVQDSNANECGVRLGSNAVYGITIRGAEPVAVVSARRQHRLRVKRQWHHPADCTKAWQQAGQKQSRRVGPLSGPEVGVRRGGDTEKETGALYFLRKSQTGGLLTSDGVQRDEEARRAHIPIAGRTAELLVVLVAGAAGPIVPRPLLAALCKRHGARQIEYTRQAHAAVRGVRTHGKGIATVREVRAHGKRMRR